MGEVQKYQQPVQEALRVVNKRNIQVGKRNKVADIGVYGNYLAVDAGDAGYSVAVLAPEDARVLKRKPPMRSSDYLSLFSSVELSSAAGVLLYGVLSAPEDIADLPVTGMLVGFGGMTVGGVGAVARRVKRLREQRRSVTQACSIANQNFISGGQATFSELSPETPVKYREDREVAYGELWSVVSKLHQEVSRPKSILPDRHLYAANMMRGMVASFWTDIGREEFLRDALEPWTSLKPNLERLRVYQGTTGISENFKDAYQPQVLRTAGNVAGIVASFLDARGIELYPSASQQHKGADTAHSLEADREMIGLLTDQGTISRARTDVLLSLDAAYRRV